MALLEVIDHYPSSDQTDVPIDIAITLTFNKEVADQFLTSDYFKVYVLPNYSGQINISITKNNNKVILNPTTELPKNTMFEVFVAGDMNLEDNTEYGIKSVDGDLMDKNYVFRFTTGEERNIDIGGGVIIPDTDKNTIEIKKTDPPNNAFDINCISDDKYNPNVSYLYNIDIFVDLPVELNLDVPLSDRLSIVRYPIIPILDSQSGQRGYQIITDMKKEDGSDLVTVNYHPDFINEKNVIRITINDRLICNSDYIIELLPQFMSYVSSSGEFTLYESYKFTFRTTLYPMLTTVKDVRMRLGQSITNISDKLIDEYILSESVDFVCKYNNCKVNENMFHDYLIRQYITCMVVKRIILDVGKGSLGLVKQRSLGDLSIVYDLSGLREMIGDLDDCINYGYNKLFGRSKTGVKSQYTYNYPGRRRNVFDI